MSIEARRAYLMRYAGRGDSPLGPPLPEEGDIIRIAEGDKVFDIKVLGLFQPSNGFIGISGWRLSDERFVGMVLPIDSIQYVTRGATP